LKEANAIPNVDSLRSGILARSGAKVFKIANGIEDSNAIVTNVGGIDNKLGNYKENDEFTVRVAVSAEQNAYVDIKIRIKGDNPAVVKSPVGNSVAKMSIAGIRPAKITDRQWTGRQTRPAVSNLTFASKTLLAGRDYTLSYGANKNIGKGTVTIKGIGQYQGAKTVTFKIVPKKTTVSKAIAGKRLVKVTWKKSSAAQKVNGYQIRYKTVKSKTWKQKTVSTKSKRVTVKKLKKGKRYQFQIRTYKTVGGVNYYAPWSAAKTSKKVK
jgi:hypothetical protein